MALSASPSLLANSLTVCSDWSSRDAIVAFDDGVERPILLLSALSASLESRTHLAISTHPRMRRSWRDIGSSFSSAALFCSLCWEELCLVALHRRTHKPCNTLGGWVEAPPKPLGGSSCTAWRRWRQAAINPPPRARFARKREIRPTNGGIHFVQNSAGDSAAADSRHASGVANR